MTSIVRDRNDSKQHAGLAKATCLATRLATLGIALLLALVLYGTAALGDTRGGVEDGATAGAADTTDTTDDAALPFDPAQVGLAGRPAPLRTDEDFAFYRNIQQAINFSIHRRFEEAGIAFAYPTQELILRRGPSLTD